MTCSVVIGTRDRPDSLKRCLETLIEQTHRPAEVILVDDGHFDPAPFIDMLAQAGIDGHYVNKSHDPGLTKSRNVGIRLSTGDVVVFLDDDVALAPSYLAAIERVYEMHPEAAGVGGRLVGTSLSRAKHVLLKAFLLDSDSEGIVLPNGVGVLVRRISHVTRVDWFSGCNMSYRRWVFDRFMFDEEFAGNGWGDDRDFSYRVSREFPLFCAPDAEVRHFEEPRGRARDRQFGRTEITYVHRFFVKHMPRTVMNVAALWWAFAGIALKNVLTGRLRRLAGNISGLAAVATGRSGSLSR
jgi:glycosyltransferase involved in cell wall biosynthesis